MASVASVATVPSGTSTPPLPPPELQLAGSMPPDANGGDAMTSPLRPILMAPPAASPALDLPFDYNAAAAFIDGALSRGWGERTAIRAGNDIWSYARLAEGTNRAGNA